MKHTHKYLIMTLVATFSFLTFINVSASSLTYAKTTVSSKKVIHKVIKKVVLPQPVINNLGATYNKGEKISIKIGSTNFTGKVQYKVTLNKIGTKTILNLSNGYSGIVNSKISYAISLPLLFQEGRYKLTVYTKRSGYNVAYDKYVSKTFSISKDVIINKDNMVYILPLNNMNLEGKIYITASNATIKNVRLNGTIIVNSTKAGSGKITLENVKTSAIEIRSVENIILNNVTSVGLKIINVKNKALGVELRGNTIIKNAYISSKVKFNILKGSGITKLEDPNNYSNLSTIKDDNAITPPVVISPTVTTVVVTPSAVESTPVVTTPPAVEIPPTAPVTVTPPAVVVPPAGTIPVITPPVVAPPVVTPPPTLPISQKPLTIEYAGMLLSTSDNPVAFTGSGYNYSMNLSSLANDVYIMKLCIIVSNNCTLTIQGVKFQLAANMQKQIRVLTDFGLADTGHEGAGMISARTLFGNNMSFNGTLSDEVNTPISVNINVQLK